MLSAVGHPFPTQQPFNHRQAAGAVPHYISLSVCEHRGATREKKTQKGDCLCRLGRTQNPTEMGFLCFFSLKKPQQQIKEKDPFAVYINRLIMDANWSNKNAK